MCTNNTPSSFHAVKIFHGPSQVEGSSLGLWEGVLGEALLRRENTSGTVALGSIPPQQYHATTLDKDTHSKRCRLMPSAGATAQKHMAKNTRLRARAAPLQVAQDANSQLLACPRRTLQHERRPPCPCWLPAARDARPPACSAVHRAASRRSIESTSVRSRLQLEAVWADELTTILQLGLVRRTFYSTGSGPQILCACRAGDGSSKSTAGSWRSG